MTRPFLKWPGGKYRLVERIRQKLRPGKRLIEPFTGSGAVFLNTGYEHYLLADTNPDLINLYRHLTTEGQPFIDYCQSLFVRANNRTRYYRMRAQFNQCKDTRRKSALFLYLNRHCYNGLVRYNRRGEFNTPFGLYKKPYFPEQEMQKFITLARRAEFVHADFQHCMQLSAAGDTVYCDPPYVPLTDTACFTDYHSGGFGWQDQVKLVELAATLANRGVQVVISNHDTASLRKLYKDAGALISGFQVRRTISADTGNRGRVGELLAVFD